MRAPSDEELAAIVAAVEVAWPQPVVALTPPRPDSAHRWKFSGRWWSRPAVGRRR